MPLYVYIKAPIKVVECKPPKLQRQVVVQISKPKPFRIKKSKLFQFLSVIMVVAGFGILSMVAAPLFYYQYIVGPSLVKKEIIRPVPVVSAQETSIKASDLDYTKASAWFPAAIPQPSIKSQVSSYTISIPDLRIKDATVKIGAEDLNRSLIHYGGTGYPGEYGVSVVFGHSILPVFYDPTSYMAMFSTLPTLKKDAKIIINYDGIEYTYKVYDKVVVDPNDVSVLEQHYDNSYLYLISCYPPGTYYKRIVVRSLIEKPN